MTERKQNYTAAIIVMFSLFFMIAFVTNLAGSMGVIVTNQFSATKALSQLGSLANFIAYACMGIPAGVILKRKGYKFTSLLAVFVGFLGVAIQFTSGYLESFMVYVAGAFVAGFSMCMLNIVVNPMLNTLGGGGNKGNQLIQFGGSCNCLGGTLAPMFVGWLVGGELAKASVTRVAPVMIIALSIFAIAFVVILFTKIPEPHMETAEEKMARKSGTVEKDKQSPLSFRHFVLGAIAVFCYVGTEVGIPNTANVYFSDTEIGPALAGTMVGGYYLLMLFGRLAAGAVGAKVSSKMMLSVATIAAMVLLFLVIVIPETTAIHLAGKELPVSMAMIILCGFFISVMWGTIFNLSTEGLGKYTAAASGIFMTLVCGGGIIPFVQNFFADRIGSINSYWLLIACLAFILFYSIKGCKVTKKA